MTLCARVFAPKIIKSVIRYGCSHQSGKRRMTCFASWNTKSLFGKLSVRERSLCFSVATNGGANVYCLAVTSDCLFLASTDDFYIYTKQRWKKCLFIDIRSRPWRVYAAVGFCWRKVLTTVLLIAIAILILRLYKRVLTETTSSTFILFVSSSARSFSRDENQSECLILCRCVSGWCFIWRTQFRLN